MGGYGSGNWPRLSSKPTTGNCHSIDIRWLKRRGYLWAGSRGYVTWSRCGHQTGSISFKAGTNSVVLHYSRPDGVVICDQKVFYYQTPCHFGGYRLWFRCPGCSRRVAILYAIEGGFYCRICCDLRYESQREDRLHRTMRKAQKLRVRLGATVDLFKPIIEKPKGMNWTTFHRLKEEADFTNMVVFGLLGQYLDTLERN